ncbi:MAG: glycosyltransferase, partial [Bacteroidota bacterium]
MKKLLVIGLTWPEPSTTAAGNRMLQLLHFFADAGYQIVFGSASKETEYTMDLLGMGISKMPLVLNHASFDAFLMDLKPDVVLFDRFLTEEQFGWRVKQQLPETLRILNTEDLHSLRQAREKALISDQEFSNTAWAQADVTKREIASIYRSDLSLIVSDHEMRLLTQDLKIDPALVFHLPFMLNGITKTVAQKWPLFQERKDFITYGNGKHAPNRDAIRYLKNTIWPLIRKRMPQARIWI